jgi:HPt (histidine-containing phosphotransfer) domain-containing protein
MWITGTGNQAEQGDSGDLAQSAAIPAPFDLEHLQHMTHGDRALAREVLRLFAFQAERQLSAIRSSAEVRERSEAAHALKGAARGVGAFAVAHAAEEIEAKAGDAAVLAAALARLEARIKEATAKLPELMRD